MVDRALSLRKLDECISRVHGIHALHKYCVVRDIWLLGELNDFLTMDLIFGDGHHFIEWWSHAMMDLFCLSHLKEVESGKERK